MTEERLEFPQGTLDLLILKALALESLHGWALSERLQQISGEAIQVQQGSLYPALHRLERRGWVKAKWAISENNRRAKYYELTSIGRKQLAAETITWRKLYDRSRSDSGNGVGVRHAGRISSTECVRSYAARMSKPNYKTSCIFISNERYRSIATPEFLREKLIDEQRSQLAA